MRYYVIAGSRQEYNHWISDKITNPVIYTYVKDTNTLIGTNNPDGIFIGTWYKRKDIDKILETLLTTIRGNQSKTNAVIEAKIYHREWEYKNTVYPNLD